MKAHLLFESGDLDVAQELPPHTSDMEADLELGAILDAMAAGDAFVREIAERLLVLRLTDPEEIRYRQEILVDCMQHPDLTRELYALAVDAGEARRKAHVVWFNDNHQGLIDKSLRVLDLLIDNATQLRKLADEHASTFRSRGFIRLVATLQTELDDTYLETLHAHLRRLQFPDGALISAELGRGNRSTGFVLRRAADRTFFERIAGRRTGYTIRIPPRDEHGFQAAAELRDRGVRLIANALAQATDHMVGFFRMLRAELAFYVGALNLRDALAAQGRPIAFPVPVEADESALEARGLYDVALAFHLDGEIVGNDVRGTGERLVVITGANHGGKSTLLRSLGIAQLMLQAGMFVGAESMRASVVTDLFTHFKREEDATMTSGKLEEELLRMHEIANAITPGAVLLANEPFAATNEREGSEIGRQVVWAMLDAGVRVVLVTHLYNLAESLHRDHNRAGLFLRAERGENGSRPFKVTPGPPLPTSFAADSYRRIFGEAAADDTIRFPALVPRAGRLA